MLVGYRTLMPENAMRTPEIVHALLVKSGWSRRELADAMGVEYQTLGRWLAGKANPNTTRFARAIALAGFDPQEFGLRPPAPASIATTPPVFQKPAHTHEELQSAIETLDRVWDSVQLMPQMMRLMAERIEHLERTMSDLCSNDRD